MIQVGGIFSASAAGYAFNLAAGAALPGFVVEGQIFIVTDQAVANWHISTNRPASPVAGDMWVQVAEGSEIITLSNTPPYFRIGLTSARRYNDATWDELNGYMGVGGVWRQFALELPPVGTPFDNFTWEQIDRISRRGRVTEFFEIGDTKNVPQEGVTYTHEIIGFYHDDLADGSGKAGMTMGLVNCLNTTYRINASKTNTGGWESCEFRGILQSTIKNQLPAELRTTIKLVHKRTSVGSLSSSVITSTDDLFLLSEIEGFGTTSQSPPGEGVAYARFVGSPSRIRRVNDVASLWWTRSPTIQNTGRFIIATAAGSLNSASGTAGDANNTSGIAFAYCI